MVVRDRPVACLRSRYATPTQTTRFSGRPLTTQPFVHLRLQRLELVANPCDNLCVLHAAVIAQTRNKSNTNLFRLFLRRPLVTACMNWAATEQRIAENPLKGIKRKKTKRRERIIPPAHMDLILTKGPRNVVQFLTVLSQCGTRPFSELAKLTAAMIDWQNGTVTFQKHKNANKGKLRVVYLTPETLELLRKLAEKHSEGLLFRTRFGNPWNRNSCRNELARTCCELGIPSYSTYDFRRTYITQGLANGLTAIELGPGWVLFAASQSDPPPAEELPCALSQGLEQWLRSQPAVRVRSTLPDPEGRRHDRHPRLVRRRVTPPALAGNVRRKPLLRDAEGARQATRWRPQRVTDSGAVGYAVWACKETGLRA